MRAHISPIDASFAHHGEGFLAGRVRDGANYGVVKVSAMVTICIRNPRNDASDAYKLKQLRAAFSESMLHIRCEVETKAITNANDSFRPVC
jgi:hypothetical protein